MANQDQCHVLLYGLAIFSKHQGVLNWGDYTIIKKDCGKDSKMSQTQKKRKKVDTTFPVANQYRLISDKSRAVLLFHVEPKNVPTPPGFIFGGMIKLQENIHTASSYSNSIEYLSFYHKPEYYHGILQRFDDVKDHFSFNKNQRNINEKFVKSLLSRPECLSKNSVLTKNQSKIATHFHTTYDYPSLININGSFSYATGKRRPNGKLQAMAGPAIICNSQTYKLSTKGRYFFRGIPYSSSSTIKFINHSIHPEYIRTIHQYFS